jgi:hypothetical protein
VENTNFLSGRITALVFVLIAAGVTMLKEKKSLLKQ